MPGSKRRNKIDLVISFQELTCVYNHSHFNIITITILLYITYEDGDVFHMVPRQLSPRQLISRQLSPRQLSPRQLSPRQLIHVNLNWDQLSHLNLNLATIDSLTIDPSYFSSSKIEIDITFSKNHFLLRIVGKE